MAKNKTAPTKVSVEEFLQNVEHPRRKEDAYTLLKLYEEELGEEAVMWGPSIVGFGSYHYKYESGREGDMCAAGFSPRKSSLSIYITAGFDGYQDLLSILGKHKASKGCLYINKLQDVDMDVLRKIIRKSYDDIKNRYT